jgi:hypothetical protein
MGTGELQYARRPPLLFGVSPLLRSPMNGISRGVESYMVDRFTVVERLLFLDLHCRGAKITESLNCVTS